MLFLILAAGQNLFFKFIKIHGISESKVILPEQRKLWFPATFPFVPLSPRKRHMPFVSPRGNDGQTILLAYLTLSHTHIFILPVLGYRYSTCKYYVSIKWSYSSMSPLSLRTPFVFDQFFTIICDLLCFFQTLEMVTIHYKNLLLP